MQLGDILVGRGLVNAADIEAALARQLTEGGRLGDNLIAMGLLTAEQLAEVMNTAPAVPANLEETGISPRSLLNLMLKFMLIEGCETVLDLAERLKLPRRGVQQLIDDAVQQRLIQAVGTAPGGLALSIRHALSETGRGAAKEALDQNLYTSPAAVTQAAAAAAAAPSGIGLHRETFDQRWVACKRPVVVTGGEMTLDMLDLQHSAETKFYDAPLHVKALNGMLLIDDFGRQKFNPDELLNRMIVPMENQVDYFKLITGTTFSLPFDVLLIFSTNLQPADLMEPAFLRRMQYKIKLFEPTREEYRQIFDGVAKSRALTLSDDVFDFVVERLRGGGFGLAYYQPRFICDQVVEACKCFNMPPELTEELVAEALSNLYFDIEDVSGAAAPQRLVAAA